MRETKKYPIDNLVQPIQKFMNQEKSGGLVLALSVIIALFFANSPWAEEFHHIFEHKLGFNYDGRFYLEYTLHHWINDGLMAIFFFVVGLELKREFIGGELSNPRKALLPIVAAVGGMVVPAIIYFVLNPTGDASKGWGIPMATDIAFSLGVLYLLGRKIPVSLKIFLTALAIVDDLGAVLVIAFFYTSDISLVNLSIGLTFAVVMFIGNKLGIRNIIFYAFFGIIGVWIAFLLSGVHATIAAVIAAFTIPANVRIKENLYIKKIEGYLRRFKTVDRNDGIPTLTEEQLHILDKVNVCTKLTIPPLQRLEHAFHPFVTFVVIPIFALANAGVSIKIDPQQLFSTNIALGVAIGLLVGKVVGVTGATLLFVKLKVAPFPKGMNVRNLIGIGLLAGIGFTMSLFVTSLAFKNPDYMVQAKIGIFAASIVAGVLGYWILNKKETA
jgi:NhaA family Na+:H+ antiporter